MKNSLLFGLALVVGFAAQQVMSKDETRPSEEVVKAFERYGTPGPEHARLKMLEGNYEAKVKAIMEPGQPARENVGRSEQKLIYGGLFLQENWEGTCPVTGKPLHGMAFTGFDNLKRKYVSTWIESLASGISVAEGTADPSGKVITFRANCMDPVTGKEKTVRQVLTIIDDRNYKFQIYQPTPEGGEFLALEINYTKK